MAYIFGIALVTLLFIVLHFFTEISLRQKVGTTLIAAFLILGAYLFNQSNEDRRLHQESVLLKFKHGKNIVCDSIDVNNSEFAYSSGTQTFLGKKESRMNGRIISLDLCE